ncbi:hypothetical protein GCM10010191_66380 [Actinomadura vinacea]|uniref:Uncharacterized protein n=1 Tax=Actinomadura vinacea TaxID=115336 RepID=A0ABN3JVS5_9ACTN
MPDTKGSTRDPAAPHRTKGPGHSEPNALARSAPFGRWPDPREDEGHDESDEEDPAPKITQGLLVTWFAAR